MYKAFSAECTDYMELCIKRKSINEAGAANGVSGLGPLVTLAYVVSYRWPEQDPRSVTDAGGGKGRGPDCGQQCCIAYVRQGKCQ